MPALDDFESAVINIYSEVATNRIIDGGTIPTLSIKQFADVFELPFDRLLYFVRNIDSFILRNQQEKSKLATKEK